MPSSPPASDDNLVEIGDAFAGLYTIEELLGQGGMASVYKARRISDQTVVAIKILHPKFAADTDVRARFRREAYVANRVRHPAAVPIVEDGTTKDGRAYLIMPLLEGASINTIWERRNYRLLVPECIAIALELLRLLAPLYPKPGCATLWPMGSRRRLRLGTVHTLSFEEVASSLR